MMGKTTDSIKNCFSFNSGYSLSLYNQLSDTFSTINVFSISGNTINVSPSSTSVP